MVTLISRCDIGNIILSALVAHKINAFDRDDGYCAHISIIHHVRPGDCRKWNDLWKKQWSRAKSRARGYGETRPNEAKHSGHQMAFPLFFPSVTRA
jgi:hypothetical protein